MKLDLAELLREAGKQETVALCEPPIVDDSLECTTEIRGELTINNAGDNLLLRGAAQTRVALSCSRCSATFEQPTIVSIQEQFELRRVAAGPRSAPVAQVLEEDASPIAGKLFVGQVLDLTELLRQYILLEEPVQPLPELLADGRCAHCRLLPAEVLGACAGPDEPEVHPALARLGELFNTRSERG